LSPLLRLRSFPPHSFSFRVCKSLLFLSLFDSSFAFSFLASDFSGPPYRSSEQTDPQWVFLSRLGPTPLFYGVLFFENEGSVCLRSTRLHIFDESSFRRLIAPKGSFSGELSLARIF